MRWRKRIGEGKAPRAIGPSAAPNAEWLLTKTIEAGRKSGAVDDGSLSRVAVDTIVMDNMKGDRGCSAAA
ncbi:hypothetical protein GCM10008024_24310 [Allgaiera indica]|uniref:Uncharacterized protein n=1 Tax=Allgaiera indica TaxID=765699 RepID=A0AAN4US34_9RHOB|nr:hypothetical protein GCM10008024_24310 [Allgaiera indica]